MIEKLKPCPFCGENSVTAEIKNIQDDFGVLTICFFKCSNPECGAVISFDNDSCNGVPITAIDYWNRRADNA